jgi:hypothetical protein
MSEQTKMNPPVSQVPMGAPVSFQNVLEKMVMTGYAADPKEFKPDDSGFGSLGFYGNSKLDIGGLRFQVMTTVTVVNSKKMTAPERAEVKRRLGILR